MGRGGRNFIPRPDADFDAWVRHYAPAQAAWWAGRGLDPASLAAFTLAYNAWRGAFTAHGRAQHTARSARVAKDRARESLEAALRPLAKIIQTDPATTDADRARLGITIKAPGERGGRPGERGGSLAGRASSPPSSRPTVLVEVAARCTHTLRLLSEATRAALPRGVQRAELFVALTPADQPAPRPPPIHEPGAGPYRYLGSFTRFPARLTFDPDRAGLQAHYVARWASARGGPGGWSDTASATVAA